MQVILGFPNTTASTLAYSAKNLKLDGSNAGFSGRVHKDILSLYNKGPEFITSAVQTYECNVSGTYTVDIADDGSSYSITYDNCNDGFGSIYNGAYAVDNIIFDDSNPDQISFSYEISYSSLSITTPIDLITYNGSYSVKIVYDSSGTFLSIKQSGSQLSVSSKNGRTEWRDFESSLAYDDTNSVTFSNDFTLDSTRIGGAVTVDTLKEFVIDYSAEIYPHQGQIHVVGATGSQLLFTVLDNANVLIEVDADGDGVYQTQIPTTWAAL